MATTPNLGLPIAAPEENTKTFYEFRSELYESMMTIDTVLGNVLDGSLSGSAQADYEQNNATSADYIKNRPFYKTDMNLTWNGGTSNRLSLLDSNAVLRKYGDIIAPDLPIIPSEYKYMLMFNAIVAENKYTEDYPYGILICSTTPFYYEDNTLYTIGGATIRYTCTTMHTKTWMQKESNSYDESTGWSAGTYSTPYWANANIVNQAESSVYITASNADIVFGAESNLYKLHDDPIASNRLSSSMIEVVTTTNGSTATEIFNDSVITFSEESTGVYAIGDYVYVANAPGDYLIPYLGDLIIPLTIPEAGIYFWRKDSNNYVKSLSYTIVKKMDGIYLPYYYLTKEEAASLDLTQFKAGDILFLVGDVDL